MLFLLAPSPSTKGPASCSLPELGRPFKVESSLKWHLVIITVTEYGSTTRLNVVLGANP